MGVKYNSSGGGSVTLDAPSTASNLTVTLPSASGTLVSTGSPFSGGTANGVVYLNGSSVPTTGSALTFDGTNLGIAASSPAQKLQIGIGGSNDYLQFGATSQGYVIGRENSTGYFVQNATQGAPYNKFIWQQAGTEQMRLDSTGLGIGTNSPAGKLDVSGGASNARIYIRNNSYSSYYYQNTGGSSGVSFPASQAYLWDVEGTELMRLDSSGNVGIGTSSPVAKQQIKGSGTSGQVTASWVLENSSSGTAGMDITGAAGSSYLRLLYGGGPSTGTNALTETMRVGLEGASAGVQQIKFAATQVPSSDANTLDDYEEGTFTPYIQIGGATTGITYTAQNGTYTKVGKVVTCSIGFALSNKGSATGQVRVWGLPFQISCLGYNDPTAVVFGNSFTSVGYLLGLVGYNGTTSAWLYQGGTTSAAVLTEANLQNVTYWTATYVYQTTT